MGAYTSEEIRSFGPQRLWAALSEESEIKGERNDCAIRAVAAVTGTSYGKVHEMMAAHGRRGRRPTPYIIITRVLKELGYKYIEHSLQAVINTYGPGYYRRITMNHFTMYDFAFKGRNWLVINNRSRHICAALGHEVVDWSANRKYYVNRLWEIVKA